MGGHGYRLTRVRRDTPIRSYVARVVAGNAATSTAEQRALAQLVATLESDIVRAFPSACCMPPDLTLACMCVVCRTVCVNASSSLSTTAHWPAVGSCCWSSRCARRRLDTGVHAADESTWPAAQRLIGVAISGMLRSTELAIHQAQLKWVELLSTRA